MESDKEVKDKVEDNLSDSTQLKDAYKTMVELSTFDKEVKQNMLQMATMGYQNFDLNLTMLQKYNNDVVMVVNCLCNGMVSDSVLK